jgi:hypothetical protein
MSSEVRANKISPATGTALQISDSGDTTTIPSGATLDVSSATMTGFTIPSGQTLTVASGGTITNSGTATGFGEDNTPAFHIVKTATQNIADDTWTKVTWDSTTIDTNSGADLVNEKWTVPSGEGGKYFVYSCTFLYSDTSHDLQETSAEIRVNNTGKLSSNQRNVNDPMAQFVLYTAGILDLAAADYIDIWAHSNVGSSNTICHAAASAKDTFFGAFKLVGIA